MEPSFTKMDGLGNDFIILDARTTPIILDKAQIVALCARSHAVTGGCDQLIILEPSQTHSVFMRIYNANGGEVDACGNATRAVGYLLHQEEQRNITIQTQAASLNVLNVQGNDVTIDMGPPKLEWQEIPLSKAMDTLALPITEGPLTQPVAVNMGNPHMVFFVQNTEVIDLLSHGPILEKHALFPAHANVGIAEIMAPDHIRLRVFERGVGETLACGTGACAALVAAVRRNLAQREATISLPGGDLFIHWHAENNHISMRGNVRVQTQPIKG